MRRWPEKNVARRDRSDEMTRGERRPAKRTLRPSRATGTTAAPPPPYPGIRWYLCVFSDPVRATTATRFAACSSLANTRPRRSRSIVPLEKRLLRSVETGGCQKHVTTTTTTSTTADPAPPPSPTPSQMSVTTTYASFRRLRQRR